MLDWLTGFLAMRGLPPHGYCLLWDPRLVWTHVIADATIAVAYFSIPLLLWRFLRARRDIEFGWMLGLFATFILACGTTHLFNIYVLWVPAYGAEAVIKATTALASIGTAILLVPLVPKLIAVPSPAELRAVNAQLVEAIAEGERTAGMLRQSQKLEALGRLTGGVAHDFNNLLQIVIGNLERAQRLADAANPMLDRALSHALTGAERAAELTDQLLTFARRQPLDPQPHSLAGLVTNIAALLERSLGPKIAFSLVPGPEDDRVIVDRNQLENALLNLAINARDAMPEGGTLTVSIHHAEADGRLELRVTDTGTGMDAEVLERATEPFFTTKEVGQGTGLGLSQVYGMVEQNGGLMHISSIVGTGTTVSVFIPRATQVAGG